MGRAGRLIVFNYRISGGQYPHVPHVLLQLTGSPGSLTLMTAEKDIEVARHLAESGVPIFLAKRAENFPLGGANEKGYWLPSGWQTTKADPSVLDAWRPGMAVCAVMGHTVDGVDKDPRNGGTVPEELQPRVYGRQLTPSGGTHDLVAPLNVRSRDGVLPGVDVKAGVSGAGHGFLFIAPTERVNGDGEIVQYTWDEVPNLDELVNKGGDNSGRPLAEKVNASRRVSEGGAIEYDGLSFDELTEGQQNMARVEQDEKVEYWSRTLENAAEWPEGYRDSTERGWEALTRDFAWTMASIAACPWMPMSGGAAEAKFHELLPEEFAADPKCRGKWHSGLLSKAAEKPVNQPPWADFVEVSAKTVEEVGLPSVINDASMADWMMEVGLGQTCCWVPEAGWKNWSGKVWVDVPEEFVIDSVRKLLMELYRKAIEVGAEKAVVKKLETYQSYNNGRNIAKYMRGVVRVRDVDFDTRNDLLNVANGVVNLATGELKDHKREYRMTKIAGARYVPGATHPDWDKALRAVDPDVADWLQIRFGQAATGRMTSDDVIMIGQGSGSNGKTTLITAIKKAMYQYAVTTPERVLNASPGDHPTEMMVLKGARMAFIDETPEASQLNTARLKTITGSTTLTARKMRRDVVEWTPTHSMFVMTNHIPLVKQNDHGTWRRLALVKFDKTFPPDDAFRDSINSGAGGLTEAVLAWIVEGAMKWYAMDKRIPAFPPKVRKDTDEWKNDSDKLSDFVDQFAVVDASSSILSADLLEQFNAWLREQSQHPWGDHTVSERMGNLRVVAEGLVKKKRVNRDRAEGAKIDPYIQSTPIPTKPTVWDGLRWRRPEDPVDLESEFNTEMEELL